MEENKKTPQQKYYEANKEKIAAQRKARYEANKEYQKKYREVNREKMVNYHKVYYENNKEILKNKSKEKIKIYDKEQRKKYYENNKEVLKNKAKEYYFKNKEKRNEYTRKYNNERYHNNPIFNLKQSLRNLINKSIKRKGGVKRSKTELILNCSYEEFKQHIETLWSHPNNLDENGNVWMTWENKGNPKDGILEPNKTWDIDHKIPVNDANSVNEVIKLNHYTNLQPMCSFHNRKIKGVN